MNKLNTIKGRINIGKFSEVSAFRFKTILKMVLIPMSTLIVLIFFLYILIEMNLAYFKAFNVIDIGEMESAYYDYLFSALVDMGKYTFGFLVFMAVIGMYISNLLLRPFKIIAEYCECRVANKKAEYNPDFFSDLKLLTSISDFFFYTVDNVLLVTNKSVGKVPSKFTKIHKPVFERAFFLQFFFIFLIVSLLLSAILYVSVNNIYENLVTLSLQLVVKEKVFLKFFNLQKEIFSVVLNVGIICNFIFFISLAFNLYDKVSSPAFGIFSTMRSFIKGNYGSRIHLVGYYYMRDYCRSINKYFAFIQKSINENKS